MGIPDREHREALTRAGDAEERAAKAERDRDEARAVIAAACAALGASATGDLAADVARVVERSKRIAAEVYAARTGATRAGCERDAIDRERAAAEATLCETTVALERVQREARAAEERGVRAGLEAAAARLRQSAEVEDDGACRARAAQESGAGRVEDHRWRERLCNARAVMLHEEAIAMGDLDVASIAARIEAPPVEAAAVGARHAAGDVDTAPHRRGDVWRNAFGEGTVTRVADPCPAWVEPQIALDGGFLSRVDKWRAEGWRRIRCAPAVGDVVHVGDGVEGVATGGDVAGERV